MSLAAVAAAGGAPAAGLPQFLDGVVQAVADGDTLTLVSSAGRTRVRLAAIDAPELHQDWGRRSAAALRTLALGRKARIVVSSRDRYGRAVGVVLVRGGQGGFVNANLEQVRSGNAWVYRSYLKAVPAAARPEYLSSELRARLARRGLWSQKNPLAPWQYRRLRRR